MKRLLIVSVLALAVLAGCGSPTQPGTTHTLAELAGSYVASEYRFTSLADHNVTFEGISQGFTFTMTLSGDRFDNVYAVPGVAPHHFGGTASVSGVTLSTLADGSSTPIAFNYALSGNTLTLTRSSETFDFQDGNGAVQVTTRIVMSRGSASAALHQARP